MQQRAMPARPVNAVHQKPHSSWGLEQANSWNLIGSQPVWVTRHAKLVSLPWQDGSALPLLPHHCLGNVDLFPSVLHALTQSPGLWSAAIAANSIVFMDFWLCIH